MYDILRWVRVVSLKGLFKCNHLCGQQFWLHTDIEDWCVTVPLRCTEQLQTLNENNTGK